MNITIPVTVTPLNIDELRNYVLNGPAKHPGAKYIIRHDDK
jgi:DNA-directed RNA polymerase subunit A'